MAFVDEARIMIKAGDGGKGCESFYQDKRTRYPKPDGGDGGKGGDVLFIADRGMQTLLDYRFKQHYQGERGGHASSKNKKGKDGRHCTLRVPVGTILRDEKTRLLIKDLVEEGQSVIVAKGGMGGRGNGHHRPLTMPHAGEERTVHLELKIIADVGLVGFPNVGKSTLISAVSKVKSKIASYPFTTKQPILGIVEGDDFNFVMAGKKPRTFHVTSENPIRYIPDSPYQGHFVVWNGHGGNWIDFEGTSDIPTITKVDDRHYTVSFSGIDDQATFRSIGGLNVRTENYTWYKGGYHMTIPAGLDQVNSTLTLNITYDSSIAGINASLVYNTTQNPITSRTIYSDYMIFNASVTAPTLTNNSNVSFYWAVNVTQNDANSYNFSLSGLHQVDAFLIDDCTLYSFKALNFTLKDEISTSYVSGDTTGVFNYSKSGIYKQYSLTATAKQSFGICLSTNTTLATAYSLAYSATSYPQRTYSEDSQTLSATQQNTTLWMLNTSYGIYTTFKVVDQFNNALKDVTAEMADTIGGVSQLIEGKMTDSAGVATFWADPDESYEFTFTKTGYTTQILSITPTDKDIYTVIMASETSSNLTNVDEGVTYFWVPSSSPLINGTRYNFSINLTSSFYSLHNCTLTLKYPNGSSINSTTYNSTGTTCYPTLEHNTGTNLTQIMSEVAVFLGDSNFTVTQVYSIQSVYVGAYSIKNFLNNLTDFDEWGFDDFTLSIIAVLCIVFIMGAARKTDAIDVISSQYVDDDEAMLLLLMILVMFFSAIGWMSFGLQTVGHPAITQYGISILVTLMVIGYMLKKHLGQA